MMTGHLAANNIHVGQHRVAVALSNADPETHLNRSRVNLYIKFIYFSIKLRIVSGLIYISGEFIN